MTRALKDFINLHRGETAWLFGKGPSLDSFDMSAAGPLRVAINDVVKEVPGCLYGFANDSVEAWAHVYRPEHVLFQPLRLHHDIHARDIPVAAERIWFADDWDSERLAWSPERLAADGLCVRRGTLGSAGQILRVMGVSRIICVGIDGGGTHASRPWHTRLRHDHATDYNSIRDAFITACRIAGIEVEFFGADLSSQLSNGMKTIKIIETCLVAGLHRCAGEIYDETPLVADELVQSGRAVFWQKPTEVEAAPVIETAAAAPVAEQAIAPAQRAKKARK